VLRPPKNPALAAISKGLLVALDERKRALVAEGKRLVDLGVGDPREPTPEFLREAFLAAAGPVSQYPSPFGTPALRAAAAAYLLRRFGVHVDPESQVLACAGAKEAIFHLPLAFAGTPGRTKVVLPDPAYPSYEAGARLAGLEPVRVPLRPERGYLLEPEDVGEDVLRETLVLWVNYPHNPTGAEADGAYYRRLGAAARKYGFIVASDEVYTDLYFADRPLSMLEGQVENVVSIFSCSKRSGMTGYRSGFMAGDRDLIATLRQLRGHPGVASAEPVAAAAALAWDDDSHVGQRRAIFKAKRDLFAAFFRARGLEVARSESTIYLWVKVPGAETSGDYALRLLDQGIVVAPGSSFGPAGEGWVRVALVPTLEQCGEAIRAWERVT